MVPLLREPITYRNRRKLGADVPHTRLSNIRHRETIADYPTGVSPQKNHRSARHPPGYHSSDLQKGRALCSPSRTNGRAGTRNFILCIDNMQSLAALGRRFGDNSTIVRYLVAGSVKIRPRQGRESHSRALCTQHPDTLLKWLVSY